MSADDFQTKYSSVMESMLKSAVAETTKLFETMVDELKAEISKLKKENDDLKTKNDQFEKAKGQLPVKARKCEPLKGLSDGFDKCDTATQCDLAPIRTMVVEQCEALRDLSLQNQKEQWLYEDMNYGLQEHDYVSHRNADCKVTYKHTVKLEAADEFSLRSRLKEEDEPVLFCGQVVSDKGSQPPSDCGTEGQKGLNQELLSEDLSLPHTLAQERPSLGMTSFVKNQSSELGCSFATIKYDLQEESDTNIKISEVRTQAEIETSSELSLVVAQQTIEQGQHCQTEGGIQIKSNQTGVTVQQYHNVHDIRKPLAVATPCGDESSPELICRKRGRQLKRVRILQLPATKNEQRLAEDKVSSVSPKASSVKSKEIVSIINPAAQSGVNTALVGNVGGRKVGSLFDSAMSLTKGSPSDKEQTSEYLKLSTKITEAEMQPTPKKDLFETKANSRQTLSRKPRNRCTSVTIQDAMLLVEAMNQSTVENVSPIHGPLLSELQTVSDISSKSPMPRLPILVETPPATTLSTSKLSKGEKPKALTEAHSQLGGVQPNPQRVLAPFSTTLPVPLCKTTGQTSSGSHQKQPLSVAPSNFNNAALQKIIIVQKSSSLRVPRKIATLSSNQPTLVKTVVHNTDLHPASTVQSLPETPSLSCVPPKTIYVTKGQLLPIFSSVSSVTFRDQQGGSLANSEIRIIAPSQPQTFILTRKQDTASSAVMQTNSTVVTSELSSSSQELKDSSNTQTASHEVVTVSQKTDDVSVNLESPKQSIGVPEMANALLEACSRSSRLLGKAAPTTFPVQQPQQKFSALVRLTRLPFSVSTKESVLVSKLILEPKSMLKDTTTQKRPSEMEEFTTPCVSAQGISMTEPEPIPKQDKNKISKTVQQCMQTAAIQLSAFTSKDSSDPHLQMTKTQFLAQLAVTPRAEAPEKVSPNELPESTVCSEKRLDKTSLVARLRRRPRVNTEPCMEIEMSTVDPKKRGSKIGDSNGNGAVDSPNKNANLASPIRFDQCEEDVTSDKSLSEQNTASFSINNLTSRPKNTKPTSSPSKISTSRDGSGSRNTKPNSSCPRRSSTTRDGSCPINSNPTSLSPRSTTIIKEISKNTKLLQGPSIAGDAVAAKMAKSTFVSPKSTISARDDASPKVTSLANVSPRRTKSARGWSLPQKTKTDSVTPRLSKSSMESMIRDNRRSFTKGNTSTQQNKRNTNSFSPKRFSETTGGTLSKKAKSEPASPSIKSLCTHGISPPRARESTPKKETLSQDGSRSKTNLRLLNAKKLAKPAKAKTVSKKNIFQQEKMQNTSKTRLITEKQAGNCEAVRRITCKAVWIPPEMPVTKTPKEETKYQEVRAAYPPNDSVHPIPVRATPMVSPLQPLMVIGGHLLKNQCGECGRMLSSSAALESHVRLHKGRRPFSCTLCGKSFPDSKGLKRHGRVHRNGRIHVCPQCGKGFVYRFGLTKHLQMVHGRLKPFVCQICNKGFYTKRDVESHIRIHTGEKPFHCNLCEKKFSRRVELNVHLRWHNGEKRHWCPYCGKGFLDYNNLKRHKFIHTGEKPHSCPHCTKCFTQSGHLKKHVRNVHKIV